MPYKDPDKAREASRKSHRRFIERIGKKEYNTRQKIWRKNNPEKVLASQEKYRNNHLNEIREKQRIYNVKNPEKRRLSVRKSNIKRRYKLKQEFVEMLGGKCQNCGYNKCMAALDFHHIKPEDKEYDSEFHSKKKFLKKIQEGKIKLLCSNCHKELEWKIWEQKRIKELGMVVSYMG